MKTFDERRKSVNEYVTKIKARRRRTAIMATSICLAVAVLSAVLFIPYNTTPPDVSMYADSEYYAVIQQLNLATYQKPRYKNTFHAVTDTVASLFATFGKANAGSAPGDRYDGGPMDEPMAQSPLAPGASNELYEGVGNYEETTDNQVAGVIEADIIKRSDRYIYYLRGWKLSVYRIAGKDTKLVGTYLVERESKDRGEYRYYDGMEMFLSQDCTTITLLISGYSVSFGRHTKLVNLDVTNPAAITQKNEVLFNGALISVRMVQNEILLAYNYGVVNRNVDFADPSTYVPQYGTPENMQCISADNIVCPGKVTGARYTVLCKVDGSTLEVKGATALLSYSQGLYVSEDTIYAAHGYTQKNSETYNNEYKQTAMTEITGVSYAGEGLDILGTVTLEGSIKDQYSMDQHDGILRVVTSTAVTEFRETFYGEYTSVTRDVTERNVNLYCVDLSDWQVEASVIGFAPAGEEASSVRFDGKNAYVCTAEVITATDPVYFFDLSDLSNITYTDTGIIDGYSTSLIQLGDGYLLGIGYGEDGGNLKIEIYEETEKGVESVCAYEHEGLFSQSYKSYFIDREKNLVGLPIRFLVPGESNFTTQYILLHFDGYQLNVVKTMDCGGDLSAVRAVLIDGYFYVFSDLFKVKPLA